MSRIQRYKPKTYPTYSVGDTGPGGGVIVGVPGDTNNLTGKYYEVVAAYPVGTTSEGVQIFPYGYDFDETVSDENSKDGFLNTLKIHNFYGDDYSYPAKLCLDYGDKHKDWYLPSIHELQNFFTSNTPYGEHISSSMQNIPRYEFAYYANTGSAVSGQVIVYQVFSVDNTTPDNQVWFATVRRTGTGSNIGARLFRSTSDSGSYTDIALPSLTSPRSIAYGNGVLVIAGSGDSVDIIKSTDLGLTWSTARTKNGNDMTSFWAVKYANGCFIAIGRLGNVQKVWKSTDGSSWSQCTTNIQNGYTINALEYGNGKWVIVGNGGQLTVSTDNGDTWTTTSPAGLLGDVLSSIKYADSKWVIGGGYIYVSEDNLATWSTEDVSYLPEIIKKVDYNPYYKRWYVSVLADPFLYSSPNLKNFSKIIVQNDSPKTYIKYSGDNEILDFYMNREKFGIGGSYSNEGGLSVYIRDAKFYSFLISSFPIINETSGSIKTYYLIMRSFYSYGV